MKNALLLKSVEKFLPLQNSHLLFLSSLSFFFKLILELVFFNGFIYLNGLIY